MSLRIFYKKFQYTSLRLKVTTSIVIPLTVILGLITYIEYNRYQKALLSNLSFLATQTSQAIESSLLHEMVNRDITGLQEMLNTLARQDTIRNVIVLNPSGTITFSPNSEDLGIRLDNTDPTCQPCHKLKASNRPGSVVVTLPDKQRIFRSMNPIENRLECHKCHDPNQRIIGLLLTDLWMDPLENPLRASLIESFFWKVAIILITALVVNLVLSKLVISRLEMLSQAFKSFKRGKINLPTLENNQDEIGQLISTFIDMGKRIQTEEAENRVLSENLKQLSYLRGELLKRLTYAHEEERKRVARDLHDDLGQVLSSLSFNIELIEKTLSSKNSQITQLFQQTRRLIKETTDHMYDLIFTLRPSVLDDLGLIPTINAYVDRVFTGKGIKINIFTSNLPKRLPPEIETTLYRIYIEALSNIIRYAEASNIQVVLANAADIIHGEILDDGVGFELRSVNMQGNSPQGLGLVGMKERVSQYGGQLEIFSKIGKGTCIRIHLPLGDK